MFQHFCEMKAGLGLPMVVLVCGFWLGMSVDKLGDGAPLSTLKDSVSSKTEYSDLFC